MCRFAVDAGARTQIGVDAGGEGRPGLALMRCWPMSCAQALLDHPLPQQQLQTIDRRQARQQVSIIVFRNPAPTR